MEKTGFLVYKNNPYHKKAKLVDITPKGKEMFLLLEQRQIPWANEKASTIEISNLEATLDTLKKMIQKLEP